MLSSNHYYVKIFYFIRKEHGLSDYSSLVDNVVQTSARNVQD